MSFDEEGAFGGKISMRADGASRYPTKLTALSNRCLSPSKSRCFFLVLEVAHDTYEVTAHGVIH